MSAGLTGLAPLHGVYGAPPAQLSRAPLNAVQLSPLHPGASDLGEAAPGSFSSILLSAPPGTVERRAALAQCLAALAPEAEFKALAAGDKGGKRIADELAAFGCAVSETSKSRWRICTTRRPQTLSGIDAALHAGALQQVEAIGLWSQPGVFSWDRIDPGTRLLASRLPPLQGAGADLGCGIGVLALHVLQASAVTRLALLDIDRRAIAAARLNVSDPRAHFLWADATSSAMPLRALDFVVMNPPFHKGGAEDKALGQAFITKAAAMLRPGGACWLVANRQLPYEAALAAAFKAVRLDHEAEGYKVYEARA